MNSQQTPGAIIFLSTAWGPKHGGINAFNLDLTTAVADLLAAQRERPRVVCVVPSDPDIDPAALSGLEVLNLGHPETSDAHLSPDDAHDIINILKDQCLTNCILVGHDLHTGPVALALRDRINERAPHSCRVAIIIHTKPTAYKWIEHGDYATIQDKVNTQKWIAQEADMVFAVGPRLRDAARDLLRQRSSTPLTSIQSIPEPVMLVPGIQDISPCIEPSIQFRAVTVGRLDPRSDGVKQSRLAVASFAKVFSSTYGDLGPDPTLLLIGADKGSARELATLASQHAGRPIGVYSLPYTQNRVEIWNIVAEQSVALMLSIHEGFGLTGWEAIGAGVPLILSKNSGLYDLLKSELGGKALGCVKVVDVHGALDADHFNDNDVAQVGKALVEIARDSIHEKRSALELREMCISKGFTWRMTATTFVKACGFCIDEKQPALPALPVPDEKDGSETLPDTPHNTGVPDALLRAIDNATSDRFSIVVMDLIGDPDGSIKKIVIDELANRSERAGYGLGLQILDISASVTEDASIADIEMRSIKAHESLCKSLAGHQVEAVLWGCCLRSGEKFRLRLHWSSVPTIMAGRRYDPLHLDLPELFWQDLKSVLWLAIITEVMNFGTDVFPTVSAQKSFIAKVEHLTETQSFKLDWQPKERGMIHALLASWYLETGLRSPDPRRLQSACDNARSALDNDLPTESMRAHLVQKLGCALISLAERTADIEKYQAGISFFDEVISAYSGPEYDLTRGAALHNRGSALTDIAELQRSPAILTDALSSYDEALKIRTFHKHPNLWAMTKSCRASALRVLGEWQGSVEVIEQSKLEYEAALEYYKRAEMFVEVARTASNIVAGVRTRLNLLGTADTTALSSACADLSLLRTSELRDAAPLVWTDLTYQLGIAMANMAENTKQVSELRSAIELLFEVEEIWTAETFPAYWCMVNLDIAIVLIHIGIHTGEYDCFAESERRVRGTLEMKGFQLEPTKWISAHRILGDAHLAQGQQTESVSHFFAACKEYEVSLAKLIEISGPAARVHELQLVLARTMFLIAKAQLIPGQVEVAAGLYRSILTESEQENIRHAAVLGLSECIMLAAADGRPLIDITVDDLEVIRNEAIAFRSRTSLAARQQEPGEPSVK